MPQTFNNYSPWTDAAESFQGLGQAVASGQQRGVALAQQHMYNQQRAQVAQQNQARLMQQLQLQMMQAQNEGQYRSQMLSNASAGLDETKRYHEGQLGIATNKMNQSRSKWRVEPGGRFLIDEATGETKPMPQFGGQQSTGPKLGEVSPNAVLTSLEPAMQFYTQNPGALNPTNKMFNAGLAGQYSMGTNLQSQLYNRVQQGLGQAMPPQGPPTNQPPRAQFRFDPATGSLQPIQ